MLPSFIDKSKIPHKPGIYIYKDEAGGILYVGKAIDLYHRVASYFRGNEESSSAYFSGVHTGGGSLKTARLVENIRSVETIIVGSEMEALILEANLIKKYLPPYNISLTDDKDYLYIAVTREAFPKIITARKKDLKPIRHWFGPFPSSTTVKTTLKQLRKVFPWCSAPPRGISNFQFPISNSKQKACFYYHLGLCPGACLGKISGQNYNKIIGQFVKFMSGKKQELIEELTEEMSKLASDEKFEEAARVKKTLNGISYILQPNRVSSYLENPNFSEDQTRLGLEELQKVLGLEAFPERIEAYDISNISGTNATGSMVVLTNGEIDKSQYRKFKIKITGKPNDYAMHQEMMGRRLKHPEWPYPQLFLIDGGRGQVRAVYDVILNETKRSEESADSSPLAQNDRFSLAGTPIFGLAKKFEWLYPPNGDLVKLPKRSLTLRLLQKIRDESHRFAITYHRKLRAKSFIPTS